MKKLWVLILSVTAALALAVFAGCVHDKNPSTEVTYHFVNGGESFEFTQTQDKGSALDYSYSKVNHENVWYTSADLQTEVTEAWGDSLDVYTSFTDIEVYVMFRSENKTLSNLEIETTVRAGVTLPAALTREGYSFAGWELGGNSYTAGSEFDAEGKGSNLTFIAKWIANKFTVTYVNGDNTQTQTQEYSSAVAAAPEKAGYTFLGWFNGETKVEKITGTVTLTAKWQAFKYNVSFDLDGYDSSAYLDGEYDFASAITLGNIDRYGYVFEGWRIKLDDGEWAAIQGSYSIGSHIDAKNISFKAIFSRKTHKLSVHGKDGVYEAEINVGDDYYSALDAYAAYGFDGWYFDEAKTNLIAYKAAVEEADGDVYGSFTGRTFTATFIAGETTTQATLSYGAELAGAEAEHGYVFDTWCDEDGDICGKMPACNITLTAQFAKAKFTLSYYDGSYTVPQSVTAEYQTKVTVVSPVATESYKTFVGWSYNGVTYGAGDEITLEDNIRLVAVWDTYQIHVTLVDWDGYTIFDEEVDAGWEICVPEGSVYETVEEFAGFYDYDIYGKPVVHALGDRLIADLNATAYYVNRSNNPKTKGTQLLFMDASNFFFKATSANTYSVSGREWHYEYNNGSQSPVMNSFFIAKAFDRDLNLPVTYKGGLVNEIPSGNLTSTGAFSCALSSNAYEYDNYKVKGTMYIPSAYTRIGTYAFSGQPASVLEIGRNSKLARLEASCNFLMDAQAVYGFPAKLWYVGSYAMATGKYVQGVEDSFVLYDDSETPKRITELPSSITYIGGSAFKGCDVFEKVDLSNVTYIGTLAFSYNDNIKTLILGNKLTTIPSQVFRYCDGITSVTISAQITSIGSFAFSECSSLKDVTFEQKNSKLEIINPHAFYCSPLTKVILPDNLTEIGYGSFSYTFTSAVPSWSMNDDVTSYITEIKLPANLKKIGSYAFTGAQIDSIVFPEKLEIIGCASFLNTNIKKVVIPDSVIQIESYAFAKLEKYSQTITEADNFVLRIGKGVTKLGGHTSEANQNVTPAGMIFRGFDNIVGIEFPEDSALTEIEDFAFNNMHGLKGEIIFPSKVETIGMNMFSYCRLGPGGDHYWKWDPVEGADITKVFIPKTVNNVGAGAFSYCKKLTDVEFENNFEEGATLKIMHEAFKYCTSLEKVTLPCQTNLLFAANSSKDEVDSGAFAYCTKLKTVIFDGREVHGESGNDLVCRIYSVTFRGCTSLNAIRTNRNTMIEIALHSTFGETDSDHLFNKNIKIEVNKNLADADLLVSNYTSDARWRSAAAQAQLSR